MVKKLFAVLGLIIITTLSIWAQTSGEVPLITIEELKAKMDKNEKVVVVDVRSHINVIIKGALNIPISDLDKNLDKLPKDTLIVAVCACSNEGTSSMAVKILKNKGYTKLAALKGGQIAWEVAKYPTELVNPDGSRVSVESPKK